VSCSRASLPLGITHPILYQEFKRVAGNRTMRTDVRFVADPSVIRVHPAHLLCLRERLHASMVGSYVQDQVKIKPNFTASLGVRWEPFLAPVAASGRMVVWRPGEKSQRYPNAPAGVVFPGDPGVPDAGLPSGYRYFNPRIGLAYRPGFLSKTSIRSAFGMFTAPINYVSWNATADSAPFSPLYDLSRYDPNVGEIDFDHPWARYAPTGRKSPFPPFPTPNSSPGPDAQFTLPMTYQGGFDPNFKMGRNLTWNFSIERQIKENWLVRAAYVGSEAYHLESRVDANPGLYSLNGARINPDFNVVRLQTAQATSSYQSLQLSLEKRFSQGFQVQSNYTFSKTLDSDSLGINAVADPFNMRNNRGLSELDRPHIFVNNFVWDLPRLQNWTAFARQLIGGWQLSGIWRVQSGAPFGIRPGQGNNNSLSQQGGDLADYVPGQAPAVHQGSKNDWLNQYFNTKAFVANAPGTFGNTPRAIFHGPRTNSWDLGIAKNWRYQERWRLQFRWEMFNAFNTPSFATPVNIVTSPQFGEILSTGIVPPRVMQGALKIYW
jgi:hypothetical protein